MITFKSITSVRGRIETVTLHDGATLRNKEWHESTEKGDIILVGGIGSFSWKKGKLYEIIEMIGGIIPVAFNEFGIAETINVEDNVRLTRVYEPQMNNGDIAVYAALSDGANGFELGDIVEVQRTASDVMSDFMITRYDGLKGFVNQSHLRETTEEEKAVHSKQKMLHKLGRREGVFVVGDIVRVNGGSAAGIVTQIVEVDASVRTARLEIDIWLPFSYVELIAPAEANIEFSR